MSTNTSSYSTFTSSTSFTSSSYSSTTGGGIHSHSYSQHTSSNPTGSHSYSEHTSSNPTGTTIHLTAQEPGKPAVSQTTRIPAGGGAAARRQVEGLDARGRIEDVSEREGEGEAGGRGYEERIEEEYAKREGGA